MIGQREAKRRIKKYADEAVDKHLKNLGLFHEELTEEQQEECLEIYDKEIDAGRAGYEDYREDKLMFLD